MSINYDMLLNSILEVIDERIQNNYDWDTVLLSAEPCWDNTGIQVKSKDFTMVFDNISYELLDYTGDDAE